MLVDARRREADRARLHRVAQLTFHQGEVVVGRFFLEGPFTHRPRTQGGVPDLRAVVDALRLPVDRVEVLGERFPLPVDTRGQRAGIDVFGALEVADDERTRTRAGGGEGEAAVTHHDGRHAVPARRRAERVPEQLRVHMGVAVDEAGTDHVPFGVDLLVSLVAHRTDLGDAAGIDGDVGAIWREAGAVDERAIANHQIVRHAHHSLASAVRAVDRGGSPSAARIRSCGPRSALAIRGRWHSMKCGQIWRMATSAAEAPIGARPKKAKTDWGKYGRNPVVILALVAFIDSVDRGILPGVLDDVQDDLGFSDFQAGFLGTAFVLAGFVAVLPAGYLADRYRRTRIIAIVLASWGAISALNAAVSSFVQFAIVRAILGVGETVDNPASQSLIADYYRPELRGRAYSYQRVAPDGRPSHRPRDRGHRGRGLRMASRVSHRRGSRVGPRVRRLADEGACPRRARPARGARRPCARHHPTRT